MRVAAGLGPIGMIFSPLRVFFEPVKMIRQFAAKPTDCGVLLECPADRYPFELLRSLVNR